jgi:hydroxymethylglutaryl-CoA lyase
MRSPVRIVEVGPRDGLQNEARFLPAATKLALVERLVAAGLREIEVTSFVSARCVPQLADHAEVAAHLFRRAGVRFSALTPNLTALERALAAGLDEVAVFGAASDTFSRRNINCSVEESLARFAPVVARAVDAGLRVRGYVSCAVGCPYEGAVAPARVAAIAANLVALGCHEVALGDTTGVGTPATVSRLLEAVARVVPGERLAGHFHDTGGRALANVRAALALGVRTFDASVGGLGGCPYAPGAAGNLATEDLVALLEDLGFPTGVDRAALADCAGWIRAAVGRGPRGACLPAPGLARSAAASLDR